MSHTVVAWGALSALTSFPAWVPRLTRTLEWVLLALPWAAITAAILAGFGPERLRRWEVAGMAIVGPVAIWLARRIFPQHPVPAGRQKGAVAAGIAGVALLALLSRRAGPAVNPVGAVAAAAALLWVFVALPWMMRTGLDER